MRVAGLAGRVRRRKRPRTTDSSHGGPISPNRIKTLEVAVPNQVWAMDITYLRTGEGWSYLAAVLDVFSRKIVGWQMGDSLETTLVAEALKRALAHRKWSAGLIVHSDRGSQYGSHDFRNLLKDHQLVQSMSAKGNCYENATMESFFGTLKHEEVGGIEFADHSSARQSVFAYIETYYNRLRIHTSLQGLSPEEFEQIWENPPPTDTPSANGFSEAYGAPDGQTKKAGKFAAFQPRPSVARPGYPLEGCSPAEPSSVSQGKISQTDIEGYGNKEIEGTEKISPPCVR